MAVVEIRSHTSSYRDITRDVLCWLGISINLHRGHDNWCCNGPGPEGTGVDHRHRYFTRRVRLRSPR